MEKSSNSDFGRQRLISLQIHNLQNTDSADPHETKVSLSVYENTWHPSHQSEGHTVLRINLKVPGKLQIPSKTHFIQIYLVAEG